MSRFDNPTTGRTIYEQLAEDGHVELPSPLLALPAPEDAEIVR